MKKLVRKITVFGLVIAGMSLYSCKDNSKQENTVTQQEKMKSSTENEVSVSKTMASNTKFKDLAVETFYKDYLMLKDALVATDAETAKEEAQKLADNGNAKISEAAKEIVNADDVNKQREAFSELTKAMEPILDDALASGEIYKQFCPMAFEGKGDYWYSNSKEIRNPYFGDKMLKCGRVEETLN